MREPLRDKARLELMLQNISNVRQFTEGMTFEAFDSDLLVMHAVAYNVQSIGEAVCKLTNEFKDSHPTVEWRVDSMNTSNQSPGRFLSMDGYYFINNI